MSVLWTYVNDGIVSIWGENGGGSGVRIFCEGEGHAKNCIYFQFGKERR